MNRFSLPVLLTCTAVSFAAGFAIAWQVLPPAPPEISVAAVPAPGAGSSPGFENNPWSKAGAAAGSGQYRSAYEGRPASHQPTDEEQKLRELAQSDPAA